MRRGRRIDTLVAQLLASTRLRAKSLIVTVYGDSILPHGGTAWLGSLIRVVEPFGLNERIVRTAVFRLAKEDWLTARQIGRRSYYSLTEAGRHRIEAVDKRLYGPARRHWDGEWTIVTTACCDLEQDKRDRLRRELAWMGFGAIAPTVLTHPSPDQAALHQLLVDLEMTERIVIMRASSQAAPQALRSLVKSCWDFDKLSAEYTRFLDSFRPIWRALENADELDPPTCFLVRILLIHEYRRLVLRDPMLPDDLLATNWSGAASRVLCRNLYRLVADASERHLMAGLETADGPLPEAAPSFWARFGAPAEEREAETVE